ncbi:hypothetical protein [Ottowia sp.]|uniref:hypothetical protein n=1 Tax=Ottowia sp. TaxID=1898956 RepID=UPI001E1292D3|nr:hypothetical protein [Ottowia sp.]MCB2024447.1 hypothetical protein [Ottowia sp.]MCP5257841.1 hypothetical protein [Burkholderiaceae bacterium]HPK33346.1 hypothetical protein [Ottowia sp.]HRW70860.1 hypothetical protein [Ottowia sp.]
MKHLALVALVAALAVPVSVVHAADAKPAATKKASAKKAPVKKAPVKRKSSKTRNSKATVAKAIEATTPTESLTQRLSPAELDIAKRIYVGKISCELGTDLHVSADERNPGFFNVTTGKRRFYMHPVESRTGAVRMEDGVRQAVFLQLGNKSMLMDQKAGQRVADDCKSPEQTAFAEQMKDHPQPGLLDDAPKK